MLLTPGPVPIPAYVSAAIAQPVFPHRSAAFEALYGEVCTGLRYLFQASGPVSCVTGTGSQAVEMLIHSLLSPGEGIVVAVNGKFSQRWAAHAAASGLAVTPIHRPWGGAFSAADVLPALEATPGIRALLLTHCETSTGALSDVEEIAFAVQRALPEVLLLVDAITTAGISPFYFDAWGLDGAVIAQKSLLCPSGIAAVALSDRAATRLRTTHAGDATQLRPYFDAAARNRYPFTAPVNLLMGAQAALGQLQAEGLPARWEAAHTAAHALRQWAQTQPHIRIFPDFPADALSVLALPNATEIRQILQEQGIFVSGGQDALAGQVLRISHIGASAAGSMALLPLLAGILSRFPASSSVFPQKMRILGA